MRAQKLSPSSLWPEYSMLKSTLRAKENIDIEKFRAVIPYLKNLNVGYHSKKAEVLTREQIKTFLEQAEDGDYLFVKVSNLIWNVGGDITSLKRYGGWTSTSVAESYIQESVEERVNIARKALGGGTHTLNEIAEVTEGNVRNKSTESSNGKECSSSSSGASLHFNNCTFHF